MTKITFALRLRGETIRGLERLAADQQTNKTELARRFIEKSIESALSGKILGVSDTTAA